MKNKGILAVLFCLIAFSTSAQFLDDMESYTDGQLIYGDHWTDYGCGGTCALISSSLQAQSGLLSGLIPNDTTTDAVLDLGNKIFGTWSLHFYMYIPSERTAYMNISDVVPATSGIAFHHFYFNPDNTTPGEGYIDHTLNGPITFSFPHDEWFAIVMNVDISFGIQASTWELGIDGDVVISAGTPFTDDAGSYPTSLGGVEFFSISNLNEYYLDDFSYTDGGPWPIPIINDDMESYTDGQPISGDWWTDNGCGSGAGCSIMSSSDFANSGILSGYIPDDGTTDAILDMGSNIFGQWALEFQMYVPSNREAYFTILGDVPSSGSANVGDFYFNQDITNPGMGLLENIWLNPVNFDFPHDEWFPIVMNFELEGIAGPTWGLYIDSAEVVPFGTLFTDENGNFPNSLGGLEFLSISSNNSYYVDDFNFIEGEILSNGEDRSHLKAVAYPNPVRDVLNLKATEEIEYVVIYNLMGQEVHTSFPYQRESTVDMSHLRAGIYFVRVHVGNRIETIKIIR